MKAKMIPENMQDLVSATHAVQGLVTHTRIKEAKRAEEEPALKDEVIYSYDKKRCSLWSLRVACALGKVNGAAVYYTPGRESSPAQICAVGTQRDLSVIRKTMLWLVPEVEKLLHKVVKPGLGKGEGKKWATQFRNGASASLCSAIYEAAVSALLESREQAASKDTEALLAVEQAIRRLDQRRQKALRWTEENRELRDPAPAKDYAGVDNAFLNGFMATGNYKRVS